MTQPVKPINQRYLANVVLDANGFGAVSIVPRADLALQQTSWRIQGGTLVNGVIPQSTAQVELNGDFWQGTYSGNNDSSPASRLVTNSDQLTCEWTGGPPGGTATLTVFGLEYPAGQGIPPPASGGGPSNPILGGETLIRNSIRSQNYVPNTSGWAIFADGSLDMNNGTFRGQIIVISADGSYVKIAPNAGGKIEFGPKTVAGVTVNTNGDIFSSVAPYAGGHHGFLNVDSPDITDAAGRSFPASFQLSGSPSDGTPYPGFPAANGLFELSSDMQVHGSLLVNGPMVNFAGDGILPVDLQANGQSIGYGWVAGGGTTAPVTVAATDLTVVSLDNAFLFRAGRKYRAVMTAAGSMTAAGRTVHRLHKGVGVAGTQLGLSGSQFVNTSTGNMNWETTFYCTTANDVSTNLTWSGTTGAASPTATYAASPAITIDVYDLGPSNATQRTYLQQLS